MFCRLLHPAASLSQIAAPVSRVPPKAIHRRFSPSEGDLQRMKHLPQSSATHRPTLSLPSSSRPPPLARSIVLLYRPSFCSFRSLFDFDASLFRTDSTSNRDPFHRPQVKSTGTSAPDPASPSFNTPGAVAPLDAHDHDHHDPSSRDLRTPSGRRGSLWGHVNSSPSGYLPARRRRPGEVPTSN